MEFNVIGDKILKREHEAMKGFMGTCIKGKSYSGEDMQIKKAWIYKIEKAKQDRVQWLTTIPKAV